MNGYELEEKYGVTILRQSLFLECSEVCVCGHHIEKHHCGGTAGYCRECGGPPLHTGQVHNFIPEPCQSMLYKEWVKLKGINKK